MPTEPRTPRTHDGNNPPGGVHLVMHPTEPRTPRTEAGPQPEARTKAGQAMEAWLREPEDYEWGRKVTDAILAIEAEAGAAPPIDVERLAEAFLNVLDGGGTVDVDSMKEATDYARSIAAEYARLAGPPPEPKP